MRTSIAYTPSLVEKVQQLTDDPDEIAILTLDCAFRFLMEHPADVSVINTGISFEPAPHTEIHCLGGEDHPVDWTVYEPSAGLAGWTKAWVPSDAGLVGLLAEECQLLIEHGIDRERAAKLLRKYQSLDGAVDNLNKILPKFHRPLIVEAWEDKQPARRPMILGEEEAVELPVERFPFFSTYEAEVRERGKRSSTTNYIGVQTEEQMEAMMAELLPAPYLAVDTETSGLDLFWLDACGISLSAKSGRAFYVPTGHDTNEPQLNEVYVRDKLRELLLDKPLVFHNASFDLRVLEKMLAVPWRRFKLLADTMIMAYVCGLGTGDEKGTLSLEGLVWRLLKVRMQKIQTLIGRRNPVSFSKVPIWKAIDYAAADADMTNRIYRILVELLEELDVASIFEVEMNYIPIVVQMEENGVSVDLNQIGDIDDTVSAAINEAEESIFSLANHEFKLNSPEEVSGVLYQELQLPPGKKIQTGFSTEAQHLKTITDRHPIVPLILEYREMAKLKSTYVDNLQEFIHPLTGRLHVSWNQCGAASGRLSSSGGQTSKLNLQNQPARSDVGAAIRKAFVAAGSLTPSALEEENTILVGGDLSQIELRLAADQSGDQGMIDDFLAGIDFHTRTASRMFNTKIDNVTGAQRSVAKNANFSILYLITPRGFATRYRVSVERAKELIKLYYDSYPQVREWQQATIEFAHHHGYTQTMFGRKRWFTDIADKSSKIRGEAERAAVNMPIQGSVADIIKIGMVKVDNIILFNKWDVLVLMQVHDEVMYECLPDVAEEFRYQMGQVFTNIVTLKVPVIFDAIIGESWYKLKG